MDWTNSDNLPSEVGVVLSNLNQSISDMEKCVEKLTAVPLIETHAQV